jgi:hypothetical protein
MNDKHPITPPPELKEKWSTKYIETPMSFADLVNEAARWGADQELEACCEWVACDRDTYIGTADRLHAARRPKPPTLKEQALADLDTIQTHDSYGHQIAALSTIRRAIEALPND